ncbi:hypothetical protein DFH29DRAFT_976729, partial [Suillus ampliporus]
PLLILGKLLVFLITSPAISSRYPLTLDIHLCLVNPASPTHKFIFCGKPACSALFCHCHDKSPLVSCFVIFAQCFYIWVFGPRGVKSLDERIASEPRGVRQHGH